MKLRKTALAAGGLLGCLPLAALAGPDVVGSNMTVPLRGTGATGFSSYSIGGTQCNIGNVPLPALFSQHHPVYVANLYRLLDGRLEQIGLGCPVHSVCPLQQPCSTCTPPGGNPCDALGVGCSSPDSASYAGSRTSMGRRSEVNPFTGSFTYPYTLPTTAFPAGRIAADNNDLDSAVNPAAMYFVELQFVSPDDASAGNSLNNGAYRRVIPGPLVNGGHDLTVSGSTVSQALAIQAWQANTADVTLTNVDVPGEGRFVLGSRVVSIGGGWWRYEYALLNVNSDRAAGSFTVPVPSNTVMLNNVGFHGVSYHSGEPYSNTPWTFVRDSGVGTDILVWSTETFAANPNANALRWATLYNFRFDATSPPTAGTISIGLFKPGDPATISVAAPIPSTPCAADFDHNGARTIADIFAMLSAWFSHDPRADSNHSGGFEIADIFAFLASWFVGCP